MSDDRFPLDVLLIRLRANFGDDSLNQEEAAYWIDKFRADNERLRGAIERAGRCLVMSNNGKAEALAILQAAKATTVQPDVSP